MTRIAFALAGLGGFNAHGAGFLTAAKDVGPIPELITATSGQIVVLADWFEGKDLEQSLVDTSFGAGPLAQFAMAFSGDPGIFRPAYREALMRWWTPPKASENLAEAVLDRLAPAQVFVPTRDRADFERIAATLNEQAELDGRAIGVVFNAYNLTTGEARLFGNDRARELWPKARSVPRATRPLAGAAGSSDEAPLHPITAEAVRSALWLSLYGFEQLPEPHLVDGAYHRSCLVAELHGWDRVYVARPLAPGWRGRPPRNWFEIQDWQTEMWFSVGYKAEVDALQTINGLVRDGRLGEPYKLVDLVEITPSRPAGFFNYFTERNSVFRSAYKAAEASFHGHREEAAAPGTDGN